MEKVVSIIQARTGSSRLPEKVLLPLGGQTLLQRMLERVRAAKYAGHIVIAITTDPSDDILEKLCINENIDCFRGHPEDLLDRHYQCALNYGADAVVKIPSDCPLIDPSVIDKVIEFYHSANGKYDYVSNLHPATYPDGNDTEIMTFAALKTAWLEARKNYEREHTTPYLWENPDRFRIGNVEWESGLDYSMTHRFTIDYIEDYEFIHTVFDRLYPRNPLFGLAEILDLLKREPTIFKINSKYAGVNWYRHHLSELKTIGQDATRILES